MLIFVLDDEPLLVNAAVRIIRQVRPDAEIIPFFRAEQALERIKKDGLRPDVVFSDIQMPGISGLEMAVQLKTASPETRVVFVTGYEQYALEAFRVHAQGYILKPLEAEQVEEELQRLPQKPQVQPDKIQVQCFGYFEAFWQGEPLLFDRRQTKELFAYLIYREGTICTSEEISAILWEQETNLKMTKNRIRVLISDLRSTLTKIGMENILIRRSGCLAIHREMVDCDYYNMLDGDMAALNSFRGEYMKQYPWAEIPAGRLYFRKQ